MATPYEPLLRNTIIRALDSISRKAVETEKAAEGAFGRLLSRWNDMDESEKENVAAIVLATATAAVGAIAAFRGRAKKVKSKVKTAGRKAAAKAVKKMG